MPPGRERRHDVPRGDREQHRGRRRQRLPQALRDVEHDPRPHRRERPLPGRVAGQEHAHVGLLPEDLPARAHVRAQPAEDAVVAPALLDEPDHPAAGERRDDRRHQERPRLPGLEQEPAAHERAPERGAAHQVLHALRAAVLALLQQVRVEAAVGRLVDVVREVEAADDERGRPDRRHERHQREAEREPGDGDEHERLAPPDRRQERVAPRPDHERHGQRERALRGDDGGDQRPRVRELRQQRREIGRRHGDREREPERTEPEPHDQRNAPHSPIASGSSVSDSIRSSASGIEPGPVEQQRPHAHGARPGDVVPRRVADHQRRLRLAADELERCPEDQRARLHLPVGAGGEPGVHVEARSDGRRRRGRGSCSRSGRGGARCAAARRAPAARRRRARTAPPPPSGARSCPRSRRWTRSRRRPSRARCPP